MGLCKSEGFAGEFITLTPNQRLSKMLETKTALASPACTNPQEKFFPFQQWGIHFSQNLKTASLLPPFTLLNASQVEMLWQHIIAEENEVFLPFTDAALKAWELFQQWGLSLQEPAFLQYEASKMWQRWALRFQQILKENDWRDQQTLLRDTVCVIGKNFPRELLPQQLTLAGFTHFTPWEQEFLMALRKSGVTITEKQFTRTPQFCAKKEFPEEEAEWEAMVQWAYQKSLSGSVACVVPNLPVVKNKIIATFGRYFNARHLLNISLGETLASIPLIRAAFTGLALLEENIGIATLSDFLLSPFYEKSISQFSSRSLLDVSLKANLPLLVSKSQLIQILNKHPLTFFLQKTISPEAQKNFKTWRDFFQAHLNFLGWPGERALSPEEHQLMIQWQTLLENFASLSAVSEKITFSHAVKKLHALAAQIIFQPTQTTPPKIEILGILEAAGLPFDHVWLANAIENVWPLNNSANAFLPLSLQRKMFMPQSSTEQNLAFCQAITQQLLHSANEIMVSYATRYQGNPCAPSPLIKNLAEKNIESPVFPKIAAKNKTVILWETSEDYQAPLLPDKNLPACSSEMFKDQAACPFRAYAKHRLKAKKIELPHLGFKALTRGNFVHKILEKFFRSVTNHQTLCQLDKTALQDLLHQLIQENIEETNYSLFTRVEKIRLERLLLSWLEKEKQREPFTVIATEETLKTCLGKLPLHLRIDRIDRIADDHYLIIDYKTSRISFDVNAIEDEPQLPLYAVVSALPVESIAFGQIRREEMKLKIFSTQKMEWEKSLLKLAEDYRQGHAMREPKYGQETCRYCDLTSLCRIKESC